MRTLEIKNSAGSLSVYFPTREDVQGLKLGDLAPNAFGKLARVTSINVQCDDVNGKAFACYAVQWGEHWTMANSIKQDEIFRTVSLSLHFRSAEIDVAERLAVSRQCIKCQERSATMGSDAVLARQDGTDSVVYFLSRPAKDS
jgi:hypothetical protein